MFVKYLKTVFPFLASVLGFMLYTIVSQSNRWMQSTMYSEQYGNIPRPYLPYFSNYYNGAIMFLYVTAALYCLLVFIELRGRASGGFIGALPVKKSAVFTYIYLTGLLLVILPFLPMGAYIFYQINQIAPGVYDAFLLHNRPDWAAEIIAEAKRSASSDILRSVSALVCLYGVMLFTNTLFQKPLAALCAMVGGLGGSILCLMTVDKYLYVFGINGANTWLHSVLQLRFLYVDEQLSDLRFLLFFSAIGLISFCLGLWLYQRDNSRADMLFSFPAVKTVMLAGVTVCAGCLAVYGLFLIVGMNGLRLWAMNILFITGAAFAFGLTKKIFSVLC